MFFDHPISFPAFNIQYTYVYQFVLGCFIGFIMQIFLIATVILIDKQCFAMLLCLTYWSEDVNYNESKNLCKL